MEYFEKVYLPAQQTEFAEEISAQKKLDPSKFQTGEGAKDPEAITTESLLAGAASPEKTLTAKEDPESDILGLTPEERKALGSSMWFNMAAAGAGSKGKTVGEVLKDTLAGGAATTAKMVDPTTRIALRTKYEKAGEEAKEVGGENITSIDFMIQSEVIQRLLNCSDIAGTAERMITYTRQLKKKKQLEERRKRK